ncbi:MAG: YraN family protein [Chloroflexia bacterium]
MSRESHIATGEKGEDRATRYLLSQGCAVIARNWHAHPGEIDIVARCPYEGGGDVLAFVEVRTRHGRPGLAEESISPRKAASMAAAAYAYMAAHELDPERTNWRIDLVTVALDANVTTVNWIKGALPDTF